MQINYILCRNNLPINLEKITMKKQTKRLVLLGLLLQKLGWVSCFQLHSAPNFVSISRIPFKRFKCDILGGPAAGCTRLMGNDDEDSEALLEEEAAAAAAAKAAIFANLDDIEKAWRYAKKPLLSIGAKGATISHGNSLRQLLEAHTAVKVKVNLKEFETLEKAFAGIRDLAVASGAPEGIEMLQTRDKDRVILFGMPGTMVRIERGDWPPPPPPPRPPREYEDE